MESFVFEGSITPDALPLTLDYSPTIIRRESRESPDAEFNVTVFSGKFQTKVTVQEVTDKVVQALYMPAWTVTESLVHSAGFVDGVPYSASIERVRFSGGRVGGFQLADRTLARAHGLTSAELEWLTDLAMQDLKVKLLLSDALSMLGVTDHAPIACGRIADGVARLVAPDLKERSRWQVTRDALRVDEAFLRSLSDVSKASRHADREEVPANLNQATAHRAWALLGRYLRFRLHGELDPATFPVLTSDFPRADDLGE